MAKKPRLVIRYAALVVIATIVGVLIGYWFGWNSRTTVILVRHAEKQSIPRNDDPPLTSDGETRAELLVEVVGDAGISSIYTTQFLRTKETAAPTARHVGISSTEIPRGSDVSAHVDDVVAQLRSHWGGTTFVAGHSDTVPLILQELGAPPVAPISDNEYDNILVATVPRFFGDVTLIRAKYGASPEE